MTKVEVYNEDGKLIEVQSFEHPDDAEYFAMMTYEVGYDDGIFTVVKTAP